MTCLNSTIAAEAGLDGWRSRAAPKYHVLSAGVVGISGIAKVWSGLAPILGAWEALALKVIGCLGILGIFVSVNAQDFEVHGTIRYESYLSGPNDESVTKAFKVEVNGCDWLIRTSVPGDCSYVEKAFRQGDLFNLTMHCTNSTGRSSNVYVGLIESDEVPDDDGSLINCLWLAYASFCYFNSEYGDSLRPICCLDDRELRAEKFKMKTHYYRSSANPKLPLWIAYFNDGYYRVNSKEGRIAFKAPPPYDAGYTNAIYSATVLTNCGLLNIPLEFEFVRFAVPRDTSSATGLAIRTRMWGKATSMMDRHSSRTLLPQFPDEFIVKDNRYRSASPASRQLHYKIRSGEWLNETNVAIAKAREIKQQVLQANAVRQMSPRPSNAWIRGTWAAIAVLSLGLLYALWRRTNTK